MMGWTFMHYEGRPEEAIRKDLGEKWELVAISKDGNVFYTATKQKYTGEVSALVVLTAHKRDYCNFGMKWIGEDMAPCYYNCPKYILDMLTPTDNVLANEWRERCREARKLKSEAKKQMAERRNAIRTGTRVKFDMPIKFMNGQIESEFVVEKDGRKVRFWSENFGFRAQISRWQKRKYTVIGQK